MIGHDHVEELLLPFAGRHEGFQPLRGLPVMFGLPMGIVLFIVGLMSMGLGYVFIRKIVDIKV